MPTPGEVLVGRYRIDAPLGAGGMATVWRARDLRLERDVAIKVLLPNLAADPALAARFEREARTLAAIDDRHVIGIHVVVTGGPTNEPFLVMELCPDGSLGDRLAGGLTLSPAVALPVLADVAQGLAALHARGIVHRDVAPGNVLLVGSGARLGDLGLARPADPGAAAQAATPPGAAIGTLGYLAPELLAGGPASAASDVYGLAAVAYRALAGRLPREAASIAELVAAAGRPAAPLASAAPGVPAPVAAAVDRALSIEPAGRPSAAAMARAFAPAATTPGAAHDERTVVAALPTTRPAAPTAAAPAAPPAAPPAPAVPPSAGRPLPKTGSRYRGPALWSGELVAVAIIALLILLLVLLLGGRPG